MSEVTTICNQCGYPVIADWQKRNQHFPLSTKTYCNCPANTKVQVTVHSEIFTARNR